MKFIFPGPPKAKKRHRSCIRNDKIATYDEQKMEAENAKIKLKLMVLAAKNEFFKELTELANAEAYEVEMTFHLPLPKKLSKSEIKAIADDFRSVPSNSKPDLDNLIKFYLDVANEILYKDDKQIISINANKWYSQNPRTEFTITPYTRTTNE